MHRIENHLIRSYLSNTQVNVRLAGYNNVGTNWRDLDYTPDYNKFYYICSGEGWLRIGDKEYYPKPGQLFFMPAGIQQSYSVISKNTFTKYWCHFTAKIGDQSIFDILKVPYFIDVPDREKLESIFRDLLDSYTSEAFHSSLLLNASILRLISYYLDNTVLEDVKISQSNTVEKLSQIIDYIEQNLTGNITVKELAVIAHLQPNYFIRLFKKHMGTSPIQYINRKRIEKAKRLLAATDLTLTEICAEIGTGDIYYLSKLFKEHTGFSPTAYRQMIKQK